MIRVHDPAGNVEDFDANHFEIGYCGSLTLNRVQFKQGLNHNTGRLEMQFSNPQLVVILGPDTWSRVDNLDLDKADSEIVASVPQEMNA